MPPHVEKAKLTIENCIDRKREKKPSLYQVQQPLAYAPDKIEFVYFVRPDSVIDGMSAYASRRNMGFNLATIIETQLHKETLAEIDAVIPIPETANVAARSVAQHLGKELVDGFVKNRYVFRTFIMPTQNCAEQAFVASSTPSQLNSAAKMSSLLTTASYAVRRPKEIIQMAREAGARKVFFASCAPPITHPHIYGIGLASPLELIAFGKSNVEIANEFGADAVVF